MFFLVNQVVEVDISIQTAGREAHVVLPPVNGAHLVDVALALEVGWTFLGIEVVHVDRVKSNRACEEMASVSEADLATALDLESARGSGKLLT